MHPVRLAILVVAATSALAAQGSRPVPRPPAQVPNAPPDGSAAADGYAPIPEWLGQTRAPRPARSEAYTVETVATGLAGAFSFHFLPDGRIIVGDTRLRDVHEGPDGALYVMTDGNEGRILRLSARR